MSDGGGDRSEAQRRERRLIRGIFDHAFRREGLPISWRADWPGANDDVAQAPSPPLPLAPGEVRRTWLARSRHGQAKCSCSLPISIPSTPRPKYLRQASGKTLRPAPTRQKSRDDD